MSLKLQLGKQCIPTLAFHADATGCNTHQLYLLDLDDVQCIVVVFSIIIINTKMIPDLAQLDLV